MRYARYSTPGAMLSFASYIDKKTMPFYYVSFTSAFRALKTNHLYVLNLSSSVLSEPMFFADNMILAEFPARLSQGVLCWIISSPLTSLPGFLSTSVGMHILGGQVIGSNVNVMQCRDMCLMLPACLSVDYNSAERTCWQHTSTTYCNALVAKASCTHFKKVTCSTSEYLQWRHMSAMASCPSTTWLFGSLF